MNNTIQFGVLLTPAVAGVPVALPVPLVVPGGHAFRCRYVEFRWRQLQNVDVDMAVLLHRESSRPIYGSTNLFMLATGTIAFTSFGQEISGTAGISAAILTVHRDVWDMDYRLVMRPTGMVVGVGGLGIEVQLILAGELVGASEGQRNAIIATQGGAKDA